MHEIYLFCENSLAGIFSGIYQAYLLKRPFETIHVMTEDPALADYPRLFSEEQIVPVNMENAMKVERTLRRVMGREGYYHLCLAIISYDDRKADAVFHTVVSAVTDRLGQKVFQKLTDPYIQKTYKLGRRTANELHHYQGFLRFSENDKGILMAEYEPENNLTLYLMPHFADRFPCENFLIYDRKRKICGIHEKQKKWFLAEKIDLDSEFEKLSYGAEAQYEELFRLFVETIAIKERENPDLQKNNLPLRYRQYMIDFVSE